jgi:hypothetical protein
VFQERPPLSESPIPMSQTSDKEKFRLLSEDVQSLLLKRVIEEIPPTQSTPGFYSRLFLVPKKTGGMRPVIDLSILNSYLSVPHFKMETNRSIRACIFPGMLTTKLDLSCAYFHIPISLASRTKNLWCNRQAKRDRQKLVNLVVPDKSEKCPGSQRNWDMEISTRKVQFGGQHTWKNTSSDRSVGLH